MAGWRCGMTGLQVLVAALLALGACGPRMTWTKEHMTEDELRGDEKACLAEANRYGFLIGSTLEPGGLSAEPSLAARQQGDIYSTCMQTKGYSRAIGGAQPSSPPAAE